MDNLPASLIDNLLELHEFPGQEGTSRHLAVVCDARNLEFFRDINEEIEHFKDLGLSYKIIFLDASNEKLVSRYKASRRRHPLCGDGASVIQGIERERDLLCQLRESADAVIDTTDMLPQELRREVQSLFGAKENRQELSVTVYSFGFKHGAPVDADLVIDVRFLPNPYYDPKLRSFTGLDAPVRDYVLYRPETEEFLKRWRALLDCVMPGYVAEGKQQLAIGVGCTGGQHRSVALAQATGDYLKSRGYRVSIAHRDLKLAEGADGRLIPDAAAIADEAEMTDAGTATEAQPSASVSVAPREVG